VTAQRVLIPAAEYLRMSTEHQQYSFANQRKAIREYAQGNGFRVISSYEDAGKSGLAIRKRKGLQQLLHDVLSGPVPFRAVLVYDVSRWGRFQDDDEAAHYEFLCRNSGVAIQYCAEQFVNDGTVASSILKNLKRSMAGEYSRELSTKVFAAQKRLATDGFRPGSSAGYALRRMAVSPDGTRRRRLVPGESKPYAGDHIILVPGPAKEVAVVRRIYDRFIRARGRIGPYDIARELNREGIAAGHGGPWSPFAVKQVLTNPKYAGTLAWARTTQLLRTNSRRKPKGDWIIKEGAYPAIVDQHTFERAHNVFRKRADQRIPKEKLLRSLQRVLDKYGYLSQRLMNRKFSSYGLSTYQRYLGSMQDIYGHFGLTYHKGVFTGRVLSEDTIKLRNALVLRICKLFPDRLSLYQVPHAARRINLLLDGTTKIFVWQARHYRTAAGKDRWKLEPSPNERDGLILLCRMRPNQQECATLHLFRRLELHCTEYAFDEDDPLLRASMIVGDLAQLCVAADLVGAADPDVDCSIQGRSREQATKWGRCL